MFGIFHNIFLNHKMSSKHPQKRGKLPNAIKELVNHNTMKERTAQLKKKR
jgi:hypothetical protein